jgi:hypothetical protein
MRIDGNKKEMSLTMGGASFFAPLDKGRITYHVQVDVDVKFTSRPIEINVDASIDIKARHEARGDGCGRPSVRSPRPHHPIRTDGKEGIVQPPRRGRE